MYLFFKYLKTVLAVSSDVAWSRANHLHVWVDHFMAAKQTLDGNYISLFFRPMRFMKSRQNGINNKTIISQSFIINLLLKLKCMQCHD